MFDWRNSQYFKTLPTYLQESIMQSGVDFETEDELRKFADGLQISSE